MKPSPIIIASLSATFAAIAALSIAIPAIAQKTEAKQAAYAWTNKANLFLEAMSDKELQSFEAGSHLVTRLAELKTKTSLQNKVQRDLSLIKPLTKSQPLTRLWADYEMRQHQCLAEAIYFEARSETKSGQIGVAEVVMNRVASKHYPNSVCGVVYQGSERHTGCQFSFTCDGSMNKTPDGAAWERAQEVATLALTGMAPKLTNKATHYHTTDVNPAWASTLKFNRQIGSHKFYRFKWRERPVTRSVNMSVAPPS